MMESYVVEVEPVINTVYSSGGGDKGETTNFWCKVSLFMLSPSPPLSLLLCAVVVVVVAHVAMYFLLR